MGKIRETTKRRSDVEADGKLFTQIYAILGVIASVLVFIRGVILVRRSLQQIEFSTGFAAIIALLFGLLVLSLAVYFWIAVFSYIF